MFKIKRQNPKITGLLPTYSRQELIKCLLVNKQ